MEEILHKTVTINGIKMHIAEKGEGPVILFLHGFPELWYTWRHQILALSSLGYRAVAPDLRGYGDTEAPPSSSSYSCLHIVGDLWALIDHLRVDRVFVVGHDWGAIMGWYLCLFRPDKVRAFFCLSVPFRPRNPKIKPLESMQLLFGDDFYICRFQAPGEIESEIAKFGAAEVIKKILTDRKPGPSCLSKENAFGICKENPITLPSWLTEADIDYYASKFNEKGFTGALNYYRAMDLSWELTAPWTGEPVKVPVKYVVGEVDMVYTTPGMKEFVHGGGFNYYVPLLDDVVVLEGAGHFINQEKPEEINDLIYNFISNH
ncbi:uncharacterized protein LOC126674065 [Mercurialis annua]|uniref:uncharacterized protein LOC126674065 n=1 Tax=Mercurialis annua TaxID=3986 RepID=UPI00215DE546|nr:uncharacterized protein LOC126674065 [Mercurialis annua]